MHSSALRRRKEKPTKTDLDLVRTWIQYIPDPPSQKQWFLNELVSIMRVMLTHKGLPVSLSLESMIHKFKVVNDAVQIYVRTEAVYGGEPGDDVVGPKAYKYAQAMTPTQAQTAIDTYCRDNFKTRPRHNPPTSSLTDFL